MTTEPSMQYALGVTTAAVNRENELLALMVDDGLTVHSPNLLVASFLAITNELLEALADNDPEGRSAVEIWREISIAMAGE